MITAATPTTFDIVYNLGGVNPSVNPYSARNLKGTLKPIDLAQGDGVLARTVNGTLIDLSAPQMRKYRLEVDGEDQAPPALDGLHAGSIVTVNSHVETAFRTGATPTRSAVPGSARTEGAYTYYCMQLTMMVVEYQIERAEWEANVSWSLTLEEV